MKVYVLWDSEHQFMLGTFSTVELCKSERDKIEGLEPIRSHLVITELDLDKPAHAELYKCV